MDWTVYWFMFPVCIVVASVAMFSGISGAALLTPTFLIGFPLLGVPRLTTVAAIGTSLFLETSGFGTGLYRYLHLRLVDTKTAKALILITLPLGALGAIAARHVPVEVLRIGYGIAMLGLSMLALEYERNGATRSYSRADESWKRFGYFIRATRRAMTVTPAQITASTRKAAI